MFEGFAKIVGVVFREIQQNSGKKNAFAYFGGRISGSNIRTFLDNYLFPEP